ncbi:MAG: RsmE family RNA methyltransferase [Chlamydiota bacterium]|nr:RsmE family RNA methyltransferase [Chlamydiota bacterium]
MPHNRYYFPGPLPLGSTISLEASESLHLQKVMRKKKKDAVAIVNGRGTLAEGIVTTLHRHRTEINIVKKESFPRDPLPDLHLLQAHIKLQSLEWIIQKGTELGVSHFHFFPANRSPSLIRNAPSERWQAIAIGAMKQCGRLFLPTIHCLPGLSDYPHKERPLYFGMPTGNHLLSTYSPHCYGLAIGPEAGWTRKEVEILSLWGKPICLHPYILRAETAALAGIALLHQATPPLLKDS